MSWWVTGIAVVLSVATTASAQKQQKNIAESQIKQGEMDRVASDNATRNAEEEARRQESDDLTTQARELLRSQSTVTAIQANTGIKGVTAERQKRNIDMQNTFDVNKIKEQGDQIVFGIRQQGFSNNSAIQGSINQAKSQKPSNTNIALNSLLAGVGTGLSVASSKKST